MSDGDLPQGLYQAGLDALEQVEAGDLDLFAHDYEISIDVEKEFEWWSDGIKEKMSDLAILIPNIGRDRLNVIVNNPDCINQEELFEWGRNYFTDIPSDSTYYFFIPIKSSDGVDGVAVIMSYGDIPGGEYELFGVFTDKEAASRGLKDIFWF